jgi:hypothetical protein
VRRRSRTSDIKHDAAPGSRIARWRASLADRTRQDAVARRCDAHGPAAHWPRIALIISFSWLRQLVEPGPLWVASVPGLGEPRRCVPFQNCLPATPTPVDMQTFRAEAKPIVLVQFQSCKSSPWQSQGVLLTNQTHSIYPAPRRNSATAVTCRVSVSRNSAASRLIS